MAELVSKGFTPTAAIRKGRFPNKCHLPTTADDERFFMGVGGGKAPVACGKWYSAVETTPVAIYVLRADDVCKNCLSVMQLDVLEND